MMRCILFPYGFVLAGLLSSFSMQFQLRQQAGSLSEGKTLNQHPANGASICCSVDQHSHSTSHSLVVSPVYALQISPLLFSPGLGGSGFDLLHLDPRAINLFDDVLDGGAPDERLGGFVPGLHKCLDRLLQIRHAHETAAPNRFRGQFSKPALHQI
jgi:hypothetical protein